MNHTAGSTSYVKKGLPEVLRDFVVALSLANLWFFHVWRLFLTRHSNSYPYYHWKANAAPILLATVLDVLLLTLTLWLAATFARRSGKVVLLNLARWVFLLMFLVSAANVLILTLGTTPVRLAIKNLFDHLLLLIPSLKVETLYFALWILAALVSFGSITVLLHTLIYQRQRLVRIAITISLILAPFALVTFFQAAWQWTIYRSGEQFKDQTTPHSHTRSTPQRRVLWIVFDEMDYRLAFINRPSTVELPEFDRLRTESIFANNAYPPGGDTVLSLPALINGRLVSSSTRTAPNELMVTFADNNQPVPWSTQPNVFSAANSIGFSSALAGWYHPYCRIIGRNLTKCSWEGLAFLGSKEVVNLVTNSDGSVVKSMFAVGKSTLLPPVIGTFVRSENGNVWRNFTMRSFVNIHKEALIMARDPDLDLVMIHYPIPHPPGIYDRSKRNFSLNSGSGYLDNLQLADRAVGELRSELERAALWGSTTVLISSDHWLRADRVWRNHPFWKRSFTVEDPAVTNSTKDERVPFVLRLAGEKVGSNYDAPFNTVLSHDLILAILSGEVSKEADVAKWLDQHRSIGRSPYVEGEK